MLFYPSKKSEETHVSTFYCKGAFVWKMPACVQLSTDRMLIAANEQEVEDLVLEATGYRMSLHLEKNSL